MESDEIQFARLLSEISEKADLSQEILEDIANAMELETCELHSLFVRAWWKYEDAKTKHLT